MGRTLKPSKKSKATKKRVLSSDDEESENEVSVVNDDNTKDSDEEDGSVEGEDDVDEKDKDVQLVQVPGSKSVKSENTLVQKVFLAHKSIGELGWNNVEAVQLMHPRTKLPALFLVHSCDSKQHNLNGNGSDADHPDNACDNDKSKQFFIYEVLTMNQPTRSWFIGNNIVSDGNIYTFTPMDPLFLIASAMSQSQQARPLCDHLEEIFPRKICKIISERIQTQQLENISTKKVAGDVEAYAYSDDNTINWLSEKVKKVASFLQLKNINSSESSISSNFTKCADNKTSDTEYLRYACDIIAEYIDESLKIKLLTKFGLPIIRAKRKQTDESDGSAKKAKTDNGDVKPLEDYGSTKSTPQAAAKNGRNKTKALQFEKAAKGTHLLSKFFQVKPKS